MVVLRAHRLGDPHDPHGRRDGGNVSVRMHVCKFDVLLLFCYPLTRA